MVPPELEEDTLMRREDILAAIEKFNRIFFEQFKSLLEKAGSTSDSKNSSEPSSISI